jgi:hypothetical protein
MFFIVWIAGALLVSVAGVGKKIGYWRTFLWSLLLSPFVALFIAMSSGSVYARGCRHCGNTANEAEYCGICGKNDEGFSRVESGVNPAN